MDNDATPINNGKADNVGGEQPEFSGGISSADSGNKIPSSGYVDPALARATAGTGPGDSGTTGAAGTPKRGRGRPPGSKNASGEPKAQETRSVELGGIEKILFSIHAMGAAMLNVPELMLDQSEAKKLGAAIEAVNEQYKLSFDPKKAAIIDLVTTCGIIYGPRCVAFYVRTKTAKPQVVPRPPFQSKDETTNVKPVINGFDPANIKIVN